MHGDRVGWGPTEIDGIQLLQWNGRFDTGSPIDRDQDTTFAKMVGFWAPRRWLSPETMDVDGFVAEIEEIVRTRGFVTLDGHVVTNLARVGPWEATFEAVSIDVRPLRPHPRLEGRVMPTRQLRDYARSRG